MITDKIFYCFLCLESLDWQHTDLEKRNRSYIKGIFLHHADNPSHETSLLKEDTQNLVMSKHFCSFDREWFVIVPDTIFAIPVGLAPTMESIRGYAQSEQEYLLTCKKAFLPQARYETSKWFDILLKKCKL